MTHWFIAPLYISQHCNLCNSSAPIATCIHQPNSIDIINCTVHKKQHTHHDCSCCMFHTLAIICWSVQNHLERTITIFDENNNTTKCGDTCNYESWQKHKSRHGKAWSVATLSKNKFSSLTVATSGPSWASHISRELCNGDTKIKHPSSSDHYAITPSLSDLYHHHAAIFIN